ncbi:hypothetical protein [Desulforhopalus singaporensis]|uniref:Energy-coupling factor transport system substrate-specific component n=1 Tax=Desulforhopalus singaporensis TaxID=91360 RepID=A0A1H0RL08_9BACT|nr:hypothetical protein [Desulforhopalus singaporensis]SDP30155.1 hypothetical protein SAMN05660330_02352 [Desulforhopalus singaporensis]
MKLTLKETLFLGFCSVFIISAKAALRLHLKIPGHAMFFTLFFLMIARGSVPNRLAATFTGLFAGIIAVILGMGKGGPLMVIKFVLPGLVVDLMALVLPGLFESVILCVLAGGLAGATRFFSIWLVDFAMGMDPDIVMQHALIKSTGNILFGMAGGVAVPVVIRKLRAYGAIPAAVEKKSIITKKE